MSVRVKFDLIPEIVKPKLDGLDITTITFSDMLPNSTLAKKSGVLATNKTSQPSGQQQKQKGYMWDSWSMDLSLSNMAAAAEAIEIFLQKVDQLSKVITQTLKVMRLLSGNVKSIAMFLNFLIKKVAEALKTFLNSFSSTGVYMSVVWPSIDPKATPKYTIPVYGGYREFISRVNFVLTSSKDPDAPKFDDPKDKVGGVILAMIGGVSDPEFLTDALDNFRKLSQFFGFMSPQPSPPKNLKAVSGFYKKPTVSEKVMGVQLTWSAPDTPVTKFRIYKSTTTRSRAKNAKEDGEDIVVRVFGEKLWDDPAAEYVEIPHIFGKFYFRYTDFKVESGKKYYYKVYSMMGDKYFETNPSKEDINSPVASPIVSSQPRNCISTDELKNYTTLGINGELLTPFDLEGDWQSVTVRRLLGKSLDSMFTQIDALADKLTGLVNTGSKAMTDYLKYYSDRVASLLDLISEFRTIVERLSAYSLRGTFMLLRLNIEEGGMRHFVDRFNQACQIDNTKMDDKTDPVVVSNNSGIAKYTERGIMLGVVLLTGIPVVTTARLLEEVSPSEVDSLKKNIENIEKAITTLMKMLGLG